jgi:EmrB/QacA subfamily drug resistance transporter
MTDRTESRRRSLLLYVLCAGELMIVLDATIVNVALPSIREDLHFGRSLVWVVNAYLLTFGGFLLLGGRLGDLFGQRRLFLIGITLFSFASLACGMANSQQLLIAARAVQGLGGAVVSAVALSLIMNLFGEPDERARAMGIYGFVCAGGGSIGVLAGGALTNTLNWHWVFLVNLPIGAAVFALCLLLLPADSGRSSARLDVAGAVSVTASSMLAVYAIVNGNEIGWTSVQTVVLLGAAALLLALFLGIEARVRDPLMPLALFRLRNVATANVVGVLWAAAMFAWFFVSALYMQLVLGYSAMQVGLAYLPANLIMAAFSLGLSARLVMRFGIRLPLCESGLASGMVNTSFMMGGALGLAILASLAAAHTDDLLASGAGSTAALNGGYHVAFLTGAVFAAAASLLGAILLRTGGAGAVQRGAASQDQADGQFVRE